MMRRISRWFRRVFALDRRYGVRHSGKTEITGFHTQRHAEAYLREHNLTGVVFYYQSIDLRVPGISHDRRESFRP